MPDRKVNNNTNKEEKAINDIVDGFKAFGDAVCNMTNHESAFAHKIQKHHDNPRKLAIYLCERYSSQDPDDEFADVFKGEYQPNVDLVRRDIPAMEAINLIKDHGWKVKVGEWKDLGPQLIVLMSNGKCFHSNYRW